MDELLDHDPLLGEISAGAYHLLGLADGPRFTIPVDAELAAEHRLRLHPWLAPLIWWLVVEDVRTLPGEVSTGRPWLVSGAAVG